MAIYHFHVQVISRSEGRSSVAAAAYRHRTQMTVSNDLDHKKFNYTHKDGDLVHTHFIEVPQIEKKRAGLDEQLKLWVICDEFNSDFPEQSYYFEPGGRIGAFSIKFTKQVQVELVNAIKARKAERIVRR